MNRHYIEITLLKITPPPFIAIIGKIQAIYTKRADNIDPAVVIILTMQELEEMRILGKE